MRERPRFAFVCICERRHVCVCSSKHTISGAPRADKSIFRPLSLCSRFGLSVENLPQDFGGKGWQQYFDWLFVVRAMSCTPSGNCTKECIFLDIFAFFRVERLFWCFFFNRLSAQNLFCRTGERYFERKKQYESAWFYKWIYTFIVWGIWADWNWEKINVHHYWQPADFSSNL